MSVQCRRYGSLETHRGQEGPSYQTRQVAAGAACRIRRVLLVLCNLYTSAGRKPLRNAPYEDGTQFAFRQAWGRGPGRDSMFRVLLIDGDNIEVVYECESRSEANAWVEEWDMDPQGIVALVWPAWAPLDLVSILSPRASQNGLF